MTIEEIDRLIAEIQPQMEKLGKRLDQLRRERGDILSRRWIAANKVRRSEIVRPDNKLYTVYDFIAWIAKQPIAERKRFLEWNGYVWFTAEAIQSGRFPEFVARYEHVPE